MKRYQSSKCHSHHLIFILVASLLTSCSLPAHHKMYSGPTLPKEQVAFLVTQPDGYRIFLLGLPKPASIRILSIDGKEVRASSWDATIRVELLPGDHTIVVFYYEPLTSYYRASTREISIKFKAEASRTYLAYAITEKNKWRPVIIDIDELLIVNNALNEVYNG